MSSPAGARVQIAHGGCGLPGFRDDQIGIQLDKNESIEHVLQNVIN